MPTQDMQPSSEDRIDDLPEDGQTTSALPHKDDPQPEDAQREEMEEAQEEAAEERKEGGYQ